MNPALHVLAQFEARQLRDWKGSAGVEALSPQLMADYGRSCGQVLALAHARTGDGIAKSRLPARVSNRRCRYPLRELVRSAERSP